MKTFKINFTDTPKSTKESVTFGPGNNEFEIHILTDTTHDLIIDGKVNIVNEMRDVDIETSPFAEDINEDDLENLCVKYFSFQVNNNVDKQQLLKLTLHSTAHKSTHAFYFSSMSSNV